MATIDPAWEPSLAFAQSMGDADRPPPRVTPADAFAVARRRFLAGERIDMVAIAAELGVARATLYRWTGDRDRLLADLVTAEVVGLARHAERVVPGAGVEHLGQLFSLFIRAAAGATALRGVLAHEGESGVQMLTAPNGPVRPRLVQTVREVIVRATEAGHYRPPAAPEILADGIVSLGERYLHNGGDPSLNPDPDAAIVIVRLLLREQPD